MPKFSYVAMDSRGKETKGTVDVANQNEAINRLKEMGYFPTKVVEADKVKDRHGPLGIRHRFRQRGHSVKADVRECRHRSCRTDRGPFESGWIVERFHGEQTRPT